MNENAFLEALRNAGVTAKMVIAYSGGVDSHVLLDVAATFCARHPEFTRRAVHIHHGLMQEADVWAAHCQAVCKTYSIPITVVSVNVKPAPGESIEACARRARYDALFSNVEKDECLLLAHHADDQAETVFLQLLRGAGPAGLAAMPLFREMHEKKIKVIRPLLSFSKGMLIDYAKTQGLHWQEDPSNLDTRFQRNFFRQALFPLLKKQFPGFVKTVTRSARQCAESVALLEGVAQQDAEGCYKKETGCLQISVAITLPAIRLRNLLRFWLAWEGVRHPNEKRLLELQMQLERWKGTQALSITWDAVAIKAYRDQLYVVPVAPRDFPCEALPWNWKDPLLLPGGMGSLRLTPQGVLSWESKIARFFPKTALHLEVDKLPAQLTVCFRRGGELFQPTGRQGHHLLKKLFQEWGVPPWWRGVVPLLYAEQKLIAVAGCAIAALRV